LKESVLDRILGQNFKMANFKLKCVDEIEFKCQKIQELPPITKAIRFFHTLFAQHVSTLNWALFRCSFATELSSTTKNNPKIN
jgi:hypothetical protein